MMQKQTVLLIAFSGVMAIITASLFINQQHLVSSQEIQIAKIKQLEKQLKIHTPPERTKKRAEPIIVKTVLVAGGAGYIGSHTVRELLRTNKYQKVVVVDNLSEGFEKAIPKSDLVVFEKGDIRDAAFLDKVFTTHKIDAVIVSIFEQLQLTIIAL
jgi:FlaA1/EpsC-like NDP-sugar epimerase